MLSPDFIAGYIQAHGSFIITKVRDKTYPVFQIKTSIQNYSVLYSLAASIGALSAVHRYAHGKQLYSLLMVRDRETIINKLIPIIDNRLIGDKKIQYDLWKSDLIHNSSTWKYRTIKGITS